MLMVLAASTGAFAQYEAQVPDDMMNLEYALKADSMGRKILVDKGSYATAIELFKRSSTIYRRLNGNTDGNYVNAMALLAKSYVRNEQVKDAIKVTEKLLGDLESQKQTSDYAIILDNLSFYYAMANETAKALEASKEVLKICENADMPDDDLSSILIHAAENYSAMNEHAEAIRLQLRALDRIHQAYGLGSEKYIEELKYLQQYYEKDGQASKASKTAETIESLEKPGGGVRPVEELSSVEDCTYHRGDAYWCAEYFLTHSLSATNAIQAGQYVTTWCIKTDELNIEIDDCHMKCIGDCPTELNAYMCGCVILGQSNHVKKLTREMERQAMVWTVRHYNHNRNILVKTSPEMDKLNEYLEKGTLEEHLLELIPDKENVEPATK